MATNKPKLYKAAPPKQAPKAPQSSRRESQGVQVAQEVIDMVVSGVKTQLSSLDPNSWFGPNQPLKPLAQDSAVGRLLDYPVGFNVRHTPRLDDSGIDFRHLRGLAESCDILRLVLETRKDQIESIDWKIKAKEGSTVDESDIAKVTAFFLQPSTELDWCGWIRAMLEDLLVLDAVAVYPRLTRGGALYSLDLMDAATIKKLIDDTGRTPIPPDPAFQQILKGVPAVNYTTDELVYFMRNPRTHKFYGYSPVEQIITYINIAIRKALHQLEYYTEGNIPESISGVPETWSMEQIKEFQLYWDTLIEGNTAMRRKMRFVPLDPSKIKETRQVDLKDQFDEWIARMVCYAFSVSPSAFIKDQNRATAETIGEQAKLEGLIPFLRFLKRRIDLFIVKYIGRADIEFQWELNESIDAKTQAEIDQIYSTMKVITPDWVRKERFGLPPMTEEEKTAAFPPPPNPFGGDDVQGGGAFGNKPPAAAGEDQRTAAQQSGARGKVPPKGKQGLQSEEMDTEKLLRSAGIGKLVISPHIHIPERKVEVGDVNVTLQMPDPNQPKEN